MIARLKGTVAGAGERTLVLDVGGVGYEVFVTRTLAAGAKTGSELTLFTHLSVREDALDLYGFRLESERDFFRMLLTVSGVGPKSALNILDAASPDDIRSAVAKQDAELLHKLHGLGKKTADRLVTELKDKLDVMVGAPGSTGDEASFVEAITSLGYSLAEARQALKQVGASGTLAERVKQGLQFLSRR